MFTGPALPLPPEFPLRQLITLITDRQQVGAWVRHSGAPHRLTISAQGRCVAVTMGEDLGALLCCCSQVVLRAGSTAVVIPAETLIRRRALQVVVATAQVPNAELLREIFPNAELDASGFSVPTRCRSPEEVLADCARHGVPVMQSRIVYKS
jgi:hypothetical protein